MPMPCLLSSFCCGFIFAVVAHGGIGCEKRNGWLAGKARREVQIDCENVQLQDVHLTVHKQAKIWTGSAQVTVDELLHVGTGLRGKIERDEVGRDVLSAHRVDGPLTNG